MKKSNWLIKTICAILLVALAAPLLSACKPETELPDNGVHGGISDQVIGSIVIDGSSEYTIVLPEDASENLNYSAGELQYFIAESTGVYLPVRAENQIVYSASAKIISLGNTAILKSYNFDMDFSSLNGDGFYLRTADKSLFICGAIDRGTMYGVYDFAEKIMGVRFFASDSTLIPKMTEIKLNAMDVKEVPDFMYRAALQRSIFRADADKVFYTRNRSSHDLIKVEDVYGNSISWYEGVPAHSSMHYVPVSEYFSTPAQKQANSGMYAFKSGVPFEVCESNGITDDGKLDETMEVSTIKAAIKSLKKFVLDDPDADYYMFGQMDFKEHCTCEKCVSLIQRYGTWSGINIRFINVLIEEVQKWADTQPQLGGKQINVVTFAYLYGDAPPTIVDKDGNHTPVDSTVMPNKNMIIRFAPFYKNRYYSVHDEKQTAKYYATNLDGWKVLSGGNIIVWEYASNYSEYFTYYPSIQRMKKELTEYKDAGIFYYMVQLDTTEKNDFQSVMMGYIFSKMLWDISLDPYELRAEFIEGYFGPAAEAVSYVVDFMDEYYAELQDRISGLLMQGGVSSAVYHPKEYLEHMDAVLVDAVQQVSANETLSAADKEMYLKRIAKVRLVPLYIMTVNRDTYFANDNIKFNAVAREFFEICDWLNVEDYGEHRVLSELINKYPYTK